MLARAKTPQGQEKPDRRASPKGGSLKGPREGRRAEPGGELVAKTLTGPENQAYRILPIRKKKRKKNT